MDPVVLLVLFSIAMLIIGGLLIAFLWYVEQLPKEIIVSQRRSPAAKAVRPKAPRVK